MNWDRISGDWKQFAGKVKEQWGLLTDNDVLAIEGKREQLIGRLQEVYGFNRDEAEEQVGDWESKV